MKKTISLCFSIILALTLSVTSTHAAGFYTDVESDFWAKEEIEFLSNQSIITGYKDGSFKPNHQVTRAQAAIMVAGALDLELSGRPDPGFTDIRADFHAYQVVAAVADEGIIQGRDGRFMPNAVLTRGQMAAILQRAFGLQGQWDKDFSDVSTSHLFYDEIHALAANRITTGYPVDNSFRSSNPTTRAQFSVFLARTMDDRFKPNETSQREGLSEFEAKVVELTNVERRKHGLSDLQADLPLSKVAKVKSKDMYENRYFSHTSPVYGSPFDMMSHYGITYTAAGENIAMGHRSAEAVVEGWMNSEGHRANMLNNTFTHIGVGYHEEGHYWTQMFMRK